MGKAKRAHLKLKQMESNRAEYGKEVIGNLARDLTNVFGKGWSKKHLHHCLRFAETFLRVRLSLHCRDN